MPRKRVWHLDRVRAFARVALDNGGTLSRYRTVRWDISAGCTNPYCREIEGRAVLQVGRDPYGGVVRQHELYSTGPAVMSNDYAGYDRPLWLDIIVPCRRCKECLYRRSVRWRARAQRELDAAPRTWFGTLTMSPEAHFIQQIRADVRLAKGGTVWTKLSTEEQFSERCREGGKELTTWLKRVRKESDAKLRYCLVAEAHKSGLPHWHILVHEVNNGGAVTERQLRLQWRRNGFSRFQLVKPGDPAAVYVCKYLSKAALARVRASIAYGNTGLTP